MRIRKRAQSESSIQRGVVDWARARYKGKLVAVKGQTGKFGTMGYPDYAFYVLFGCTFFIEFKRPGAKPTKVQERRHKELRDLGFTVGVIDDVVKGRELVAALMHAALGGRS